MILERGQIVVYRERGNTLDQDRVRRATFAYVDSRLLVCFEGHDSVYVHPNDVLRIEPSQHGWTGVPETSGAW